MEPVNGASDWTVRANGRDAVEDARVMETRGLGAEVGKDKSRG